MIVTDLKKLFPEGTQFSVAQTLKKKNKKIDIVLNSHVGHRRFVQLLFLQISCRERYLRRNSVDDKISQEKI